MLMDDPPTAGDGASTGSMSRRQLLGGLMLGVGAAACSAAEHHTSPVATASSTPTSSPAAKATSKPAQPASEIVHGSRTRPRVSLTFHGAGDVGLASSLLAEVERAGAHVTVLGVGTWLAAEPGIARRILDGGHELGNHTYHHLAMRQLSATRALDEIVRCAQQLRKLTGSAGRWFRPSGTPHATSTILRAAGLAGYAHSLSYDVDPRDYQDPAADTIVQRVLTTVRPGSIISLHLGHPDTVKAMPALLDGLSNQGLAPATVSELLG
jgi:peptidoglycan/xylan/chitin deacetylase (PgdA/CDA1 family)